MAIYIDDYKEIHPTWNGEGLIPYRIADHNINDTARLTQSVVSAVDGAARITDEIQKIVSVGNHTELYRGLENFQTDVIGELEKREDYEELESAWNDALQTRLHDYIPEKMDGVSNEELQEAIRIVDSKGKTKVSQIVQLGLLKKAKSSWQKGLFEAENAGDLKAVEQSLSEGRGFFVTSEDESKIAEKARQKNREIQFIEEIHQRPLDVMAAIEAGDHPVLGDAQLEKKVVTEARAWSRKFKVEYGNLLLEIVGNEGVLTSDALALGKERGLISDDQIKKYQEGL